MNIYYNSITIGLSLIYFISPHPFRRIKKKKIKAIRYSLEFVRIVFHSCKIQNNSSVMVKSAIESYGVRK